MLKVKNIEHFDFTGWDIALFAAGSEPTKIYAPKAASQGCVVIDNSSLYRMDPDVPLIVPEVNPDAIDGYTKRNIIANPNCSTAQMVVALKPLHDAATIRRVVVSTYQSVSGAGKAGMDELFEQSRAIFVGDSVEPRKFTKQIAFNVIPHIDVFMEDGGRNQENPGPEDQGQRHLRARAGVRGPFGIDQYRIRKGNFSQPGARHPARGTGHHAGRQARGRRVRHPRGMRGRQRHLYQPRA
jgi:aspartate-semialdehyde dehydrogenase